MTSKKIGITEKEARLRLWEVRGVGLKRYVDLMAYFGSGKKVLAAPIGVLAEVVPRRIAELIFSSVLVGDSRLKQYEQQKVQVLINGIGTHYPILLAEVQGPPVLYVRGKLELLLGKTVAMVGSRRPTGYGIEATHGIVEGLAASSVVVVSGLAEGIDSVAHRAALNAGGGTVAVLGCGLLAFGGGRRDLFEAIGERGLLVSQFPPFEKAQKGHFVVRNRTVAGLSLGVVVVEGAVSSGSAITPKLALEMGRKVFAVPGAFTSELSQAPIQLLKSGAVIVTEAQDVLKVLDIKEQKQERRTQVKPEYRQIWTILGRKELDTDTLARELDTSVGGMMETLTLMELEGLVVQRGMLWQRAG